MVDAKLNKQFKEIIKRLDKDVSKRNLLRDAQKAWVAFRNAECTFSASNTVDSSVYSMIYTTCLTDLTQKRSVQLLQYLDCEEGDLSCPVPEANE